MSMKTKQAFDIVVNMAKKQLEDCPNCGKSQWKELEVNASQKGIRNVWGNHYREAIAIVEDYSGDLVRED